MFYEIDRKSPEFIICLCRGITRKQTIDFILENHIEDLKTLCEKMPIGDRCGGCREDLEKLLLEVMADEGVLDDGALDEE